jgi:hypothetical protein
MATMHPLIPLAFILLAAVALTQVSQFASAPDVSPAQASSAQEGDVATPNHDPQHAKLVQPPTSEAAATAETVATVATPNHDPRHLRPMPSIALEPVALRAEPEPATPSALAFAAADTTLYARDGARLRAGPSATADVLTKLAADARIRAVARSTDGAWWRVSLTGGRIGYVHRTAVSQNRVKTIEPAAPATQEAVVADTPPQPVSGRRSQGLLDYVDETMNWLAGAAGGGSAPTIVRTER